MDCAHSLELLSEYRDGVLGEAERGEVTEHLSCCPPCSNIFEDLNLIVIAAGELGGYREIPFPDEDGLWQRMNLPGRIIH